MIERYSEGCFRLRGRTVSKNDLDTLLIEAQRTALKRARICVHYDENDAQQEMFVLLLKDSRKGTYKYRRANSMFLLRGRLDIEFQTAGGEILETVELSAQQPFIKIEAGVYHRPIIISEFVLMHETRPGPWDQDNIVRKT